jgi:hypothetical protein
VPVAEPQAPRALQAAMVYGERASAVRSPWSPMEVSMKVRVPAWAWPAACPGESTPPSGVEPAGGPAVQEAGVRPWQEVGVQPGLAPVGPWASLPVGFRLVLPAAR